MLGSVLSAIACGGNPCADTERETADGACEPDTTPVDTDVDTDTDTTPPDPSDAGTLTAEVTPSAGVPYTFVASSVSGGVVPPNAGWNMTARGTSGTDFLAWEFKELPAVSTYEIGAVNNPNFCLYSDLTNLGTSVLYGSVTGTLTVTRWEVTEFDLGEAWLADGTFEIDLSDGQQPQATLEMTGTFTDVFIVGDAYQSR